LSDEKKEDKERAEALADWRSKNWKKVLNDNMRVLEFIRDSEESSHKNRIEAAKTLARMADILSPEKIVQSKKAKKETGWWETELPPEELAEIDSILTKPSK
jgi:hypothetical protein